MVSVLDCTMNVPAQGFNPMRDSRTDFGRLERLDVPAFRVVGYSDNAGLGCRGRQCGFRVKRHMCLCECELQLMYANGARACVCGN